MAQDPINTGYAHALFAAAQAENALGRIEEELFRLRELLKTNPALVEFLKDPNIKREGKRQALTDLFQGRVQPLVLSSLLMLSDLDRAGRVALVIDEFIALAAASRQQVSGEVVTAIALDAATLARLTAELSRLTGKNVHLLQRVDPAILGGAIIQIGDQIIDGSLRRKLNQIKEQMAQ
jgi:F-type H+-transporting ATPase subunit delta